MRETVTAPEWISKIDNGIFKKGFHSNSLLHNGNNKQNYKCGSIGNSNYKSILNCSLADQSGI